MAYLKRVFKMILIKMLTLIRILLDLFTELVFGFIYKGKSETLPPIRDLTLLESAQSLAAKIRCGKLKSEDLVKAYISRIQEVNPILNAVVDTRFKEAVEEAKSVDKMIQSSDMTLERMAKEKPFLGVPFTIKDCFQVKGLRQTSGLVARKDYVAQEDAPVVTLLRKAGAIPIAVTNVSELCMWWESSNYVYGRSNNPYDTTRIVGGSSGGEGSILGAAGSIIGVGSDIGGSLRMPAFFNGIFCHKPTKDIVPNDGQFPIAKDKLKSMLATGPMCRYASDLLPMYRVLSQSASSKLSLDKQVDVKKLKYYYMEDDGGFPLVSRVHPELKACIKKVVIHFEKAYGIKAQKVSIREMTRSVEIWSNKMGSNSNPSFCELLTDCKGSMRPGVEFLKWFLRMSNHTMPAILLGLSEKVISPEPGSESFERIERIAEGLERSFRDILGNDGIFFYPTNPHPAPYHNQPLFMPLNFAYTGIFNVLGFPVTQCPLGLGSEGLPLGVQVVSNLHNDHMTLAVAMELEKAFGGWVSPSPIP